LKKKYQKLKKANKKLELYKSHYLKQCKFHENDKEEIIKTLQKSFSEDKVVTDEDDETSLEGNIKESKETDPSDLEDEITNLCGYCNKSFKEKLIPQTESPNGLGCKACVKTEE
jgi:hypothetical protein